MNGPSEGRPSPARPEMNPKIIPGLVLIALGLVTFVATVTDSQLVGQMIGLLLGVIFLTWGVLVRHPAPLIPGCILTGLGVGIVLSQSLFAGVSGQAQGGVITLCLGLGFLLIMPMQQGFTRQGTHWWPFIPGGILSVTGFSLLLGDAGLTMLSWIGRLWPLALIVLGAALLFQALRSQRAASDAPPPVMAPSPPPTSIPDVTVPDGHESGSKEPVRMV